jgi:hypothetical protein
LVPRHFDDFANRVAKGALTPWRFDEWIAERVATKVAEVVRTEPEYQARLIRACRRAASPVADVLIGQVLSQLGGDDAMRQELALEALDAGRAADCFAPAYQTLEKMFWQQISIGAGQFEVHPKASNSLRQSLYARAKADVAPAAIAARRILASLECSRRENERPDDEPRHPDLLDCQAWTCVLVPSRDVSPSLGLR